MAPPPAKFRRFEGTARFQHKSLNAIIPSFSFTKRMTFCILSKRFRRINNHFPYSSIKSIKFQQKGGYYDWKTEEDKYFHSGMVEVDNVKWFFFHHEKSDSAEIRCSLAPTKSVFSPKLRMAREYFEFFLKFPIKEMELVGVHNAFKMVRTFKCESFKWDFQQKASGTQHISSDVEFHKVELIDPPNVSPFCEKWIKTAKFVTLNYGKIQLADEEEEEGASEFWEKFAFLGHFDPLYGPVSHVTFRPYYADTFVEVCGYMMAEAVKIDSFYTAIFKKSKFLEEYVREELLKKNKVLEKEQDKANKTKMKEMERKIKKMSKNKEKHTACSDLSIKGSDCPEPSENEQDGGDHEKKRKTEKEKFDPRDMFQMGAKLNREKIEKEFLEFKRRMKKRKSEQKKKDQVENEAEAVTKEQKKYEPVIHDIKVGRFEERDCVILKETPDYICAVFHNYFPSENRDEESFTAIKLTKNS